MEAIKSCPCCGGRGIRHVNTGDRTTRVVEFSYFIKCEDCGLRTATCLTPEDAIRRWNKRKEGK